MRKVDKNCQWNKWKGKRSCIGSEINVKWIIQDVSNEVLWNQIISCQHILQVYRTHLS